MTGSMSLAREIGESIGSRRRRDRLAGEAFVTQLDISATTCACGFGERVDGLLASVTCHHISADSESLSERLKTS